MNNVNSHSWRKALVANVLKAVFVERNPQSVLQHFSDSYIQHNPLIPNGKAAITALVASLPLNFVYEMGKVVADGNLIMVHGRYSGWGPKPLIAVDIFRTEGYLLAEHWDVMQEEVPAQLTASGHPMFP